jgi:hypothetical protein
MIRFAGYAALFDRVDRAGDVMRRGAFAGAGPVPLLLQHRGDPVGAVHTLAEDDRGLRVEGVVDDTSLRPSLCSGALAGLSVGYRARAARQGAWRELTQVDLVEVSLVAVPMQPLARIDRLDVIHPDFNEGADA